MLIETLKKIPCHVVCFSGILVYHFYSWLDLNASRFHNDTKKNCFALIPFVITNELLPSPFRLNKTTNNPIFILNIFANSRKIFTEIRSHVHLHIFKILHLLKLLTRQGSDKYKSVVFLHTFTAMDLLRDTRHGVTVGICAPLLMGRRKRWGASQRWARTGYLMRINIQTHAHFRRPSTTNNFTWHYAENGDLWLFMMPKQKLMIKTPSVESAWRITHRLRFIISPGHMWHWITTEAIYLMQNSTKLLFNNKPIRKLSLLLRYRKQPLSWSIIDVGAY